MPNENIDAPSTNHLDDNVYLLFDGASSQSVEHIAVSDISLIDIREKERDARIFNTMVAIPIGLGILVLCELIYDIDWISHAILEVLCGLSVLSVTSAFWYFFNKRYEVVITFKSGKKRYLY